MQLLPAGSFYNFLLCIISICFSDFLIEVMDFKVYIFQALKSLENDHAGMEKCGKNKNARKQ